MANKVVWGKAMLTQSKRFAKSSLPMQDSRFVTAQIGMTELALRFTTELITNQLDVRDVISCPLFVLAKEGNLIRRIGCQMFAKMAKLCRVVAVDK